MKPTKKSFFCPGCLREKMLFESKKEAIRFLKYNADAIEQETGKRPARAYYCTSCCGWHITSRPNPYGYKDLIKRYGIETGSEMYDKIQPLVSKRKNITKGLSEKLKVLRHNLKFEVINCTKCRLLIDELLEIFEVVIRAQLEDKATISNLFSKFSQLCYIFKNKEQTAEIA